MAEMTTSALTHLLPCATGELHSDASLQQQDGHAAAAAAMLSRHLADLQAGPRVEPQGTPLLSDGLNKRLERHRLRCVVCIQVEGCALRNVRASACRCAVELPSQSLS